MSGILSRSTALGPSRPPSTFICVYSLTIFGMQRNMAEPAQGPWMRRPHIARRRPDRSGAAATSRNIARAKSAEAMIGARAAGAGSASPQGRPDRLAASVMADLPRHAERLRPFLGRNRRLDAESESAEDDLPD